MSSGKRPDLSSSHDIEVGGPSETDSLLGKGRTKMTRFFHGFVDFAFQGNILQIAFGLIVAAAFTDLVKSFVSAILMPPIAIILPINKNIEEKFAVLRAGPNYNASSPSGGYNTLNQAQSDGAVVMAYGSFIYQMVSFIMVGFSLYGLAHVYTLLSHDPIIKYSRKCPYCLKRINEKRYDENSLADVSIAAAGSMAEKTSRNPNFVNPQRAIHDKQVPDRINFKE